jgi:hypothetical protein
VEKRLAKKQRPLGKAQQSDWMRKWRVKKAIDLLKEKYSASLRARVALLVVTILALLAWPVLEVCGATNIGGTLRTAGEHSVEVVGGIIAVATVALPTIAFVLQSHKKASTSRGSAIFEEAKEVKDHLGFMSKVRNELQELFDFLCEFKEKTGTKLIIVAFVDDLDRCTGGKNVKVLEAMQLILSVTGAPVIAFLAIDSRIVVSSIEESFGQVFRTAYISGWEYLDKIVQLPFYIPSPATNKVKRLVDHCLDSGGSKPAVIAARVRGFADRLKAAGADRDQMRRIECGVKGIAKWNGIAAVGSKLYCAPFQASTVLVIDSKTDRTVSTVECGVKGNGKWNGIAAVGSKLYCVPRGASSVLVIDSKTDTVSTIDCGVKGTNKWCGIAAVGSKLYCAPQNASTVLVIDSEKDTVSTIECGVKKGTVSKWNGIAAVGRIIYCAPQNSSTVLVIDSKTDTVSTIDCCVKGDGKWNTIAAVGSKLYCVPRGASSVLVIDSKMDTVSTIECGVKKGTVSK